MSKGNFAWGSEETKFFVELTPEKILSVFERETGLKCTGRFLQLNSMENRVYDLEIELDVPTKNKSDSFRIVKFYRPGRWSKEQILEEHQFIFDLLEYDIPVVAPEKNKIGESLFKLDDKELYFCFYKKVGGRSPDELSSEQLLQVGRLLARMHNVGEVKYYEHRLELNVETYGDQALNYLLENEKLPEEIEAEYEDLVSEALDLSEPLFEDFNFIRTHGDCHLGNLLWGDEGPFWVDFDDTVMAPAVQDIWLVVQGRDDYALRDRNLLVEAYQEMRPFDRQELNLIEPLRTLRVVHFHAWIAKRWQDGAFERAFPDFGTKKYWLEQITFLREQVDLIKLL